MSISKPAAASAARSAIVAFEPGRMTRSASPASACGARTQTSSTAGLYVPQVGDDVEALATVAGLVPRQEAG
jgi:hypothetical protein